MSRRRPGRWPLSAQLCLVFILYAAVFLLLGTRDYLAVDGGLRAATVYQRGQPFLHENNHLLYPVNVYAWSIALGFLGLRAKDELEFLALVQAMNATAAAMTVTVLYGLVYAATTRALVALLTALGYGFSRAFLAHATNSAEPMVGLLWSAVSAALTTWGVVRRRAWAMFAGGVALALAVATYQSMALLAVPVIVFAWLWPRPDAPRLTPYARIFSAMPFTAGFAIGIPIVYGAAYYVSGTQTVTQMFHRFLEVPSARVYAGFSFLKAASLLPGFAYALFPCLPRECSGFRCLISEDYRAWIPVAGLALAAAGIWFAAVLALAKHVWYAAMPTARSILTACGTGLICTIIPPLLWMPTYDKLWLQPLACWFFGVGVLIAAAFDRIRARLTHPRILAGFCVTLVAATSVWNLAAVTSRYGQPTPHLDAARDVATVVKPQDLLVGDWNEIFILFQYLFPSRANSINVPTEAERIGAAVVEQLRGAVLRTRATGGQVYFLGLLDLPIGEWRTLLAEKRGVPYEPFDDYRRCAIVLRAYPYQPRPVTLRLLEDCP